jgi:hypothetical protein
MRDWHTVSRHHPCPICDKADWCSVSADGTWAICRRVDTGSGVHRVDKAGADYKAQPWRPPPAVSRIGCASVAVWATLKSRAP